MEGLAGTVVFLRTLCLKGIAGIKAGILLLECSALVQPPPSDALMHNARLEPISPPGSEFTSLPHCLVMSVLRSSAPVETAPSDVWKTINVNHNGTTARSDPLRRGLRAINVNQNSSLHATGYSRCRRDSPGVTQYCMR